MAKIGDLIVNIAADTKELKLGMKKAEKTVSKSVAVIKKALIGIAISYQTINSFREASEEIDRMAKTAARLNTTVEALQQLQYAAELSGVSFQTLEMAMQRMTRRVAEAAQGTGEAKTALKELGLEATKLSQMTADEQLKRLADALQGVETQSDRVRIAMKLFDSEGVKLLNMLQGGSAQLNKYAKELRGLGLVSTDGAAGIERMNDSFTKVEFISKKFWQVLAMKLAPTLEATTKNFIDMNKSSGLTKNIMTVIVWIFEKLSTIMQIVAQSVNRIVIGFKAFSAWIDDDAVALEKLKQEMYATNLSMDHLYKALLGFEKLPKKIEVTKDSFKDLGLGISGTTTELDKLLQKYETLSMKQDKIIADMQTLTRYFMDGKISLEQYTDVMNKMSSVYDNLDTKTDKLGERMKELQDAVGSKLENAFMDTFRGMMDGATDFEETMKSMIKDIIAELIRLMVVQKLAQSISGAILGKKSSGGGGEDRMIPAYATVMATNQPMVPYQSSGYNVTVNNYGNDDVFVDQKGEDIEITIQKIAADIHRGKGPIGSAIEQRYALSKR